MASVGERIRIERESRNTTLDDMAVATGIGQSYLESLERGEYHELPGPAFGKLYIRAYAEVLGFDPQPWIDDYDREHRRLLGSSADPISKARASSRPMAAAIARWRESRQVPATDEPELEDDVTETATEPELPEPEPLRVAEAPIEIAATPEPEREPEPEPAPEPLPELEPEPLPMRLQTVTIPPPPEVVHVATRRIVVPFVVVIALALVVGLIIRGMGRSQPARPAAATPLPIESAPAPVNAAPVPAPPLPSPPPPVVVVAPKSSPPVSAPAAKPLPSSGDLTVSEFGVGRRIVNLALDGESDHFKEGDRVSFASRVLGGQRGTLIRHVWIYEGRAQQSISLRLGGPDYRTHTNKTVGKAGAWAVEARDDKGRVLARTEFTVEPRSR
jgi:transcriptional regulator with XRE-family HTH domain